MPARRVRLQQGHRFAERHLFLPAAIDHFIAAPERRFRIRGFEGAVERDIQKFGADAVERAVAFTAVGKFQQFLIFGKNGLEQLMAERNDFS